jgi:hypothetical protein
MCSYILVLRDLQHVKANERIKLVGHTWRANPLTYGMENVNAVSKNQYNSRLPGYLSIRSDYTKLARMIPCPSKNLRDPMNGEVYCVYVAYGGMVPRDDEEGFDYVPPKEQVYVTTNAKRNKRKSQDICKSVRTNSNRTHYPMQTLTV